MIQVCVYFTNYHKITQDFFTDQTFEKESGNLCIIIVFLQTIVQNHTRVEVAHEIVISDKGVEIISDNVFNYIRKKNFIF